MEAQNPQKEPEKTFRGLYEHVKISVKTLDCFIVIGIVAMILIVLFGVAHNGYTITFNSKGGSDVPSQTDLMYGDHVAEPEPPTREGYTFTGWYRDENCESPFDFENTIVNASATLYAGWEAK